MDGGGSTRLAVAGAGAGSRAVQPTRLSCVTSPEPGRADLTIARSSARSAGHSSPSTTLAFHSSSSGSRRNAGWASAPTRAQSGPHAQHLRPVRWYRVGARRAAARLVNGGQLGPLRQRLAGLHGRQQQPDNRIAGRVEPPPSTCLRRGRRQSGPSRSAPPTDGSWL
jgi:hypothetical protein